MNHKTWRGWGRLLAVSAVIAVGMWLATEGLMGYWISGGGFDLEAGHRVFLNRCENCHSPFADILTHNAPNLHDIGRTAASRKPDQTGSEYILESILDPDCFLAPSHQPSMPKMPKDLVADLSPDAIRDLVAYLASRGVFPKYRDITSLEIPDSRGEQTERVPVRRQQMELAEKIFRDKGSCFQCHSEHSFPEYRIFAPGLFRVGLTDKKKIKQSIVDPHKDVLPIYRSVSVILESGKEVIGRLISRSDDRLILVTRDDQNRLIPQEILLSDIEEEDGQPLILESTVSAMPKGFAENLTSEEIEAVITLIRQLN
jgi:mono/diheme cytochrome c family protein